MNNKQLKVNQSYCSTSPQDIKQEIKIEQVEEDLGRSGRFTCPTCNEHFISDELFVDHVKTHHKDFTSYGFNSGGSKGV